MKPLTLLLTGSVAANVALLAAFAFMPALLPPAARDFFVHGFVSTQESAVAREAARTEAQRAATASAAKAETKALARYWSTLESDDLRTLVAHLRAAGFSVAEVRAIVTARVNTRFAGSMKALIASAADAPFWKPQPMNSWTNPQFFEQMNQLYRERSKLLRDVLGDDIFAGDGRDPEAVMRRQFGDLPKAKIELVRQIADDYAEMTSQVRASTQGIMLPEDREKLALLEREKRVDLAAVLTPDELEAYEMRSSNVTRRLSVALTLMDATEEEFRTLFRIQQPFEDTLYPSMGFPGPDAMQQRRAAQQQIADQLRVALGDARYADFARASNYEFQQLSRIAERENVPAEAAVRAFDLRDSTSQEANRIFNDNSQTVAQKRAALTALAQSVKGQIVTSLGPAAGNAYVKTATWLTALERGGAVTFGPDGMMRTTRMLPPAGAARRPPHN